MGPAHRQNFLGIQHPLKDKNPEQSKITRPPFNPDPDCGDLGDLLLYGILIPSSSCTEEPLGQSGAGIAERMECGRDAGAGADSYTELNLILVVFL